jgi:hypothetical protein
VRFANPRASAYEGRSRIRVIAAFPRLGGALASRFGAAHVAAP